MRRSPRGKVYQLARTRQDVLADAWMTPHVSPRQRGQLLEMMELRAPYEPLLSTSGRVRTCKAGGCKNPALGSARKCYCPEHYLFYLEKSNCTRSKPQCVSCNVHTANVFRDQPCCLKCASGIEEDEHEQHCRAARESRKQLEFEDAETVDELKAWIEEYLL